MKLSAFAGLMAAALLVAGPGLAQITAPEGTQFQVRLEDTISSRHAQEGDRFTFVLVQDVRLPDGTVLPAGYRGKGKVVDARGNGFLGRTGKLRIKLDYLKVGEVYIPLRAVKATRGDHRTGSQVVAAVLFWPVAPLIRGKSTQIQRGTELTAFADADVLLDAPVAPPPGDI
jgi:hypothetical protein